MGKPLRVLIVEDSEADALLMLHELRRTVRRSSSLRRTLVVNTLSGLLNAMYTFGCVARSSLAPSTSMTSVAGSA